MCHSGLQTSPIQPSIPHPICIETLESMDLDLNWTKLKLITPEKGMATINYITSIGHWKPLWLSWIIRQVVPSSKLRVGRPVFFLYLKWLLGFGIFLLGDQWFLGPSCDSFMQQRADTGPLANPALWTFREDSYREYLV